MKHLQESPYPGQEKMLGDKPTSKLVYNSIMLVKPCVEKMELLFKNLYIQLYVHPSMIHIVLVQQSA